MATDDIILNGVSTNNLRSISVTIPFKKFSVVTGVSGSGKSSLVFDTLYSESYRRYVESLSSYARQYLKALPRAQLSDVKNLPPAIAVKQTRSGATNRSTVGSLTEIVDLLRVIFAHLSEVFCHQCGKNVEQDSPDRVLKKIFGDSKIRGERILISAPLSSWSDLSPKRLNEQLATQGLTRVVFEGGIRKLDEHSLERLHETDVLLDRVEVTEKNANRIVESLVLAFRVGRGQISVFDKNVQVYGRYSHSMLCCGIQYIQPSVELFSYNHPLGACTECQGFGQASVLNWDKIIPDLTSSLSQKGVECWNFGQHSSMYGIAIKNAQKAKMDLKSKPFSLYSEEEWNWLKTGYSQKELANEFDGIEGYFKWLDTQRYKPHYRIHVARFRKYILCPSCKGNRLSRIALSCKISGKSIADVCQMSVKHLYSWLNDLLNLKNANEGERVDQSSKLMGLQEALEDLRVRLQYLERMGLSYLSANRSAKTLSGGELQRIYMSRCLGSALTETLYCLDEPTSGLHARDAQAILGVILDLRDQGNTVVAVEHEKAVIHGADHVIEIGPGSGHLGGSVVYSGRPEKISAERRYPFFKSRNLSTFLKIQNASTNNLKNISVQFPTAAVTSICGVSGSGKTSLVQHTLFPLLVREIKGEKNIEVQGEIQPLAVVKSFGDVLIVSQSPIGRSSRSNIATYIGIFDEVRNVFSKSDGARAQKLLPGAFSFNTSGGRCETCRGLGVVTEDLSFLGEMDVVCPTCDGRRFQDFVLDCRIKGKNLIDVLNLTVEQACAFFFDNKKIVSALEVVKQLGLGYLTLGQSTSSFSGGEAQRVKMVELLHHAQSARPSVLIFDEPTTGLSDVDVVSLIAQLHQLADRGHMVLVVEHHLDVIRSSDWVVEIGPEAGELGGELVYAGTPERMCEAKLSRTAPFL